jgi:methanogenic corrinoid protein MtbC1
MTEMKNIVEKVKQSDLSDKVKIMIGGAPVTDSFRESIGADLYADDAASAADAALEVCLA